MVRFLRSDATHLSDKDIQDIIDARNTIKRASEAMATKYKISTRRVYQIWRGIDPPIDTSVPVTIKSERPVYSNKAEMIQVSAESTKSNHELDELYKKEFERFKKNKEHSLYIMKKEPIEEEALYHQE